MSASMAASMVGAGAGAGAGRVSPGRSFQLAVPLAGDLGPKAGVLLLQTTQLSESTSLLSLVQTVTEGHESLASTT